MKRYKKFLLIVLIFVVIPFSNAQSESTVNNIPVDLLEYETFSLNGFDDIGDNSLTSSIHKYLGYATVFTGLLTGILNPEIVGEEFHEALGITSAALATTTMGFGFVAHIKDMSIDSGFDSDNVHAILGISGGIMMMIAPFTAPGDAHKILGELGALTMGVSVVGKLVF